MLLKDLIVGGFFSFEQVTKGRRVKRISKVIDYRNGKSNILSYCPKEKMLRKKHVRIVDLYELCPEQKQLLLKLDFDRIPHEKLEQKIHKFDALIEQLNSSSVGFFEDVGLSCVTN